MPDWFVILLPKLTMLAFIFAFGACVGSLINVLVYRLPLGLDVVRPQSRCPKCNHRLTWRENIPILGWIILRGRCRFCKAHISPEYPIVETLVACMFAFTYASFYIIDPDVPVLGAIAPDWASNGPALTWPALVVILILISSLVAMTIIDARTYTIPLVLTWVPAIVALLFHTGHALWFDLLKGDPIPVGPGAWALPKVNARWDTAPGWLWTIPTPDPSNWRFIGVALGGTAGLLISNLMLKLGILTPSFADYDQWLEQHRRDNAQAPPEPTPDSEREPEPESETTPPPPEPEPEPTESQSQSETDDPHDWIMYPHARREMVRELAFLAPPALLAFLGSWLAITLVHRFVAPSTLDITTGRMVAPIDAPLWLTVLAAVLAGYLIGGAVVWAVRILGSLLFNKEAMGLGDVHMMAAVGACLGWIDSAIAFLLAAFVALSIVAAGLLTRAKFARTMPYGPSLAIATLIVLYCKPLVEQGLGIIFSNNGPLPLP